jgi:hypothetical protein
MVNIRTFGTFASQSKPTAVFDGVGGALLKGLTNVLPTASTIHAQGFLGGTEPLSFHTSLLMKGTTIKGFSSFNTETVKDPEKLAHALDEIGQMLHSPHF